MNSMNKYLVIGNPINHSLSPKLHNYWFRKNNINAFYDKEKLDVKDLKTLVARIRDKEIKGANITIPFKKDIITYLDELTEEAKSTQSVNTIYFKNDKIVGHNTDIEGFKKSIENIDFNFNNKKVLILGAGGVVSSIIFALYNLNVSKIAVSNRTKSKAEDLKSLFNNLEVIDWGGLTDFDIIINATSMGLNKNDILDLSHLNIGKNKLFYDVIYNPKETNFLKRGKSTGNIAENGMMMFVYQAQASFKIWHDVLPKIDNNVIKLLEDD